MIYIFILLYITQGESKYFGSLGHVIAKWDLINSDIADSATAERRDYDCPIWSNWKNLNLDQGQVHHKWREYKVHFISWEL